MSTTILATIRPTAYPARAVAKEDHHMKHLLSLVTLPLAMVVPPPDGGPRVSNLIAKQSRRPGRTWGELK